MTVNIGGDMDRQVNCTGCGAVGTVAPCDDIIFKSRGFFQGKSVVCQLKIKTGLFLRDLKVKIGLYRFTL